MGSDEEEESMLKQLEEQKKASGSGDLADRIALKKLELQMKMNEARKLNSKAVVEE